MTTTKVTTATLQAEIKKLNLASEDVTIEYLRALKALADKATALNTIPSLDLAKHTNRWVSILAAENNIIL